MVEVDVRGLSCPIPVVKTKKAIETNPNEPITILLDTEVSKENVTRLARNRNYEVNEKRMEEEYCLTLIPKTQQK